MFKPILRSEDRDILEQNIREHLLKDNSKSHVQEIVEHVSGLKLTSSEHAQTYLDGIIQQLNDHLTQF